MTQAPVLDPSQLVGLEPGVAYAASAVIILGMLLFYLGPGLRARFLPPAARDEAPTVTGPLPPALPAVMDRGDAATDRLVGHLERQLVERDRTIADQDRDLERLRMDVDRLRDQIWRRGPRDDS